MGSFGNLELILKDGTVKRAEVYSDGPSYIAHALEELAIYAARENRSIFDIDLDGWFDRFTKATDSRIVDSYEDPSANYCSIDQLKSRIDVDSFFVYDGDEMSADGKRTAVDLANPHNQYHFSYDQRSLRAALKILSKEDYVFWKDGIHQQTYYKDVIDAQFPLKPAAGEYLLIDSIKSSRVLFRLEETGFIEINYNN
ncbi:MAG: hypothetical protein NDI94_05940 [Candidatus Woesearchaeota archaeon]|nr:hypothetical protein [Candidatus Woesearchaeota archaeon]